MDAFFAEEVLVVFLVNSLAFLTCDPFFLFFLVSGIQLLRGKFQWMIPDNADEEKRDLVQYR